ncbi:13549_t:CDS:2 [Dentiscutata erythropus]|uniref:13549_t:CDS:1 n=1 Tax=Dentiscutata erythropus TaxID=1348616 RepID=A0A9N8WJN1_9GLOM|nr:13549_t:CDS:2 [Dentiscutata erythropus]
MGRYFRGQPVEFVAIPNSSAFIKAIYENRITCSENKLKFDLDYSVEFSKANEL